MVGFPSSFSTSIPLSFIFEFSFKNVELSEYKSVNNYELNIKNNLIDEFIFDYDYIPDDLFYKIGVL